MRSISMVATYTVFVDLRLARTAHKGYYSEIMVFPPFEERIGTPVNVALVFFSVPRRAECKSIRIWRRLPGLSEMLML